MKRILVCLLCAFSLHVCLASYGQNIGLDSYSKEDIPTPKECKKICKQLEKEGWTVHGAGYSLEESLTKYYQRQEADHLYSIIGTGEAKNINVAIRKATNNASIQYASLKGVQVGPHPALVVTDRKSVAVQICRIGEIRFHPRFRTRLS